jgi:hypothetical protein
MVTKDEALAVYNERYGTEYASIQDLGVDLVRHALTIAWIENKKSLAAAQGETETEAF